MLLGVVSGGERPARSARVYGGPTQGLTELCLRVELGERDRVAEAPLASTGFRLRLIEGGHVVAEAPSKTDELGSAEVRLRLPRPRDSAFEIWVDEVPSIGPPLAKGLVLGSLRAFQTTFGRRGGFQSGRRSGEVVLSVAPARGALVMAQGAMDDELVIRAERAGVPLVGATLKLVLEGTELPLTQEAGVFSTDSRGLARVSVRPREPHVRVSIEATAADGAVGSLVTRLDVVQGAIRASKRADRLVLEGAGAADRAFVGFFDETRRYGGLHAALKPTPDGRLAADVPWPAGIPNERLWLVTSSQLDLASPAALGWPLTSAAEPAPITLDTRELLLLDGASAARLREVGRARRVRWVTAAYAALALLLTLWLFVRRVQASDMRIERHLADQGMLGEMTSIAPPRSGRTSLAAACIGVGFLVIALLALFKR